VQALEIQIKGRVREADVDATACGAAWTAALNGVHLHTPGPPEAEYEFPSVGCIVPAGRIFQTIDDIQTIVEVISKIDQVFQVAGVALGVWRDFVVRIPLYDRDIPRNLPLNLIVQLGRRAGSALAAASISGGEIDVSEMRVVGWADIGATTYLRTWHHYGSGAVTVKRLMEVVAYDVKKARLGIEPYPVVTFTCPPYPIHRPLAHLRGRIYVIDFSWLWRLDYLDLDNDPASRVPVPDEVCSLGPIRMDFSHRVVFAFQQGVADYVITGFRPVPAQPQRGQQFDLNIAVQNIGDLSTLEADRGAPRSGEFKLRIRVGSAETVLPEARVLQPGESYEFYGLRWTCEGSAQVVVDADNEIEEGVSGEVNNTAALTLPLCEAPPPPVTRTPSATRTPTATRTLSPTRAPTPTATVTRARTATPTRTSTRTRTPTRTATLTRTRTATRSATASRTRTATRTPTRTGTPPPTPTPSPMTPVCTGDCTGDCSVTVNEVLTMVNIALGNLLVSDCFNADTDGDAAITVDEILTAVTYALESCPLPCAVPLPTEARR